MDKLRLYNEKTFDDIKHIDEMGNEYWYAREISKILKYTEWRNFMKVLNNAKEACEKSNINICNHFVEVNKMIEIAKGAKRKIVDYKLSRYAGYLIVQNADPRKEVVALGQTYFAIQTRKMELTEEEYHNLTEDEKRLYQRNLTKKGNFSLNKVAAAKGVKNFDKFHNAGYKGLYNGETSADIAKRKGLRYRKEILDNMGSDELIANLFRISQTEQKLRRNNIKGEINSCNTHERIGKIVRKAIKEAGGIMPEDLPTPKRSLKQIEKERKILLNKIIYISIIL